MATRDTSYLIIGAGVFGASTALHLARAKSSASVTLIDREPFPCKAGASWDWNKVIRADYPDLVYMRLALEAKKAWRDDPLFKEFYHESGMFWISEASFANTVADYYTQLGADEDFELLDPEEAKKLYGGIFAEANYSANSKILVNRTSGWADAQDTVKKVIEAAIALGVNYEEAQITRLEFGDDDACTGVLTSTGRSFSAAHILLCTSAATPELLADSAPDREDIQVGGRMIAAGTCTAIVKLDSEAAAKLVTVPVCCQDIPPGQGGVVPPNSRNELKFWQDISFKNTVKHSSGRLISVPPAGPDYQQWHVPKRMRDELERVNKAIFGQLGISFSLDHCRVCWDAVTPTEDFIITPHPCCRNLFVATGGSSHAWKFLPILGKYIVQMLEGGLDPKLAKIWAWNHEITGPAYGDSWPKVEMRDLE